MDISGLSELRGVSFEPDWVSHQVLVYLDDRNIPAPSFILSTGRGLQVGARGGVVIAQGAGDASGTMTQQGG